MAEPWYGDRDPQEVDMGCGEYDGTSCELCGRERVMVGGATGKRICEKCGAYQTQAYTPKVIDARNTLMRFTPEQPAWVGPAVYAVMSNEPALADLMDRVKVYSMTVDATTESPPCALVFGSGVILFDGREVGVIEDITMSVTNGLADVWLPDLTPSSLYEVSLRGPLTAREFREVTHLPPDPPGHRYGPYDADPHTKGRRKRFRRQRRS